ncbi:MAG: metal-binding protein [Betaproteobacteria bacterium HGW-Betaproteobacteria-10]|nr:MAG: metal-binding protein [Betaproteobacteria bacterium HGW-Betaproteobacteria-10]
MLKIVRILPFLAFFGGVVAEESLPPVVLYTPTVCLACVDYADHLRKNGFKVTVKPTADMAAVKRRLKVPKHLEAEPSAVLGGYFIEGHVPADDIKELLREKRLARGLAVPGLPLGAPGREYSNPTCDTACTVLDGDTGQGRVRRELYNTVLVKPDGDTSTYARH